MCVSFGERELKFLRKWKAIHLEAAQVWVVFDYKSCFFGRINKSWDIWNIEYLPERRAGVIASRTKSRKKQERICEFPASVVPFFILWSCCQRKSINVSRPDMMLGTLECFTRTTYTVRFVVVMFATAFILNAQKSVKSTTDFLHCL